MHLRTMPFRCNIAAPQEELIDNSGLLQHPRCPTTAIDPQQHHNKRCVATVVWLPPADSQQTDHRSPRTTWSIYIIRKYS